MICEIRYAAIEQVDNWNDDISRMRGNLMNSSAKTYFAHNKVSGDSQTGAFASDLSNSDFLQDITENGIPASKLTQRTGDIAFLTRTINKKAGLVTNKRVTIISLGNKIIKVQLHNDDGTTTIA